ncbi:glycosyltransferase family 4 protein [Duganella sp. PWIR1]
MTTVLHVAEVLKGGIASYLDELIADQARRYGEQNLCVLVPASEAAHLSALGGVEVVTFANGGRLHNIRAMQRALRQLLRRRAFDLVHAHSTFAGAALRTMWWPGGRPPLVYCAHGWAFDRRAAGWKLALVAWAERLLALRCESIVCISEHDRRSALARGLPAAKLLTIRNGIGEQGPVAGEVAWPASRLRILFAGRFDYQKGVDVFFGAMRELGPEYAAIAIGDAALGDFELTRQADNVRQTGWLSRQAVQAHLQSCDVFVIPSRWEGFGLAALEALRAGKAVIASRVGGLQELVEDGGNGYLIAPDSVPELVAALRRCTADGAAAMGAAGRVRFETLFSAARMNQEVAALYQSMLAPSAAAKVYIEKG